MSENSNYVKDGLVQNHQCLRRVPNTPTILPSEACRVCDQHRYRLLRADLLTALKLFAQIAVLLWFFYLFAYTQYSLCLCEGSRGG